MYSLTDDPGLPAGITIDSASASWIHSALDGSAATAPAQVSGWTGKAPNDVLATDRALPAKSRDSFTITLAVTVATTIDVALLPCSALGAGHGYYNAAEMTAGDEIFPVSACAPASVATVAPTTAPPRTPAGGGGAIALTGVAILEYLLAALALVLAGAAMTVRYRRRGKHA
jgi:hypothetical protein